MKDHLNWKLMLMRVVVNGLAIALTAWLLPGMDVVVPKLLNFLLLGAVFGLLNATSNPPADNPPLRARLLEVLPKVRKPSRIMDYVRLLQKVTKHDATTAKALLPYLKGEKLDRIEMSELSEEQRLANRGW